jgi:transcriptional regulator with XRE-family HTH domain
MKQRNFIGRLVSRWRNQRGWTQDVFADKLQLAGWHDATRSTISKIEDGSLRIDLTQVCYPRQDMSIVVESFDIKMARAISETRMVTQNQSRGIRI